MLNEDIIHHWLIAWMVVESRPFLVTRARIQRLC
jgi:hypothetical protein